MGKVGVIIKKKKINGIQEFKRIFIKKVMIKDKMNFKVKGEVLYRNDSSRKFVSLFKKMYY